jgi:hypothetical protein
MKEKTLEEFAENYFDNNIFCDGITDFEKEISIKCFNAGAKYQAERMYSEEDMYEFAKFCSDKHTLDDSDEQNIKWNPLFRGGEILSMQEMFEQFKKK